ncbi:hypothetical protein DPEC_G00231320 [Dallia pectoralis]|uniref:Uncharacterized protein n=1 Tax=Dallia pectoralis TaxID=75939 RepID=A0ACC2FX63_DALPE|nr:hypothetical protein DPEC_G00231320 [Dallia pectoralis]
MEARSKDRIHERHHRHGERDPIECTAPLEHDQIHHQWQQTETQTEKTGNGKINPINVDGEGIVSADGRVRPSYSINNDGYRHLINANIKQKWTQMTDTTLKVASRGGPGHSRKMDCTNDTDEPLDFTNHYDNTVVDDQESALTNGVAVFAYITNGYSGKSPPDNDGSGSESGYATPKKCKAKRNSVKNTDHVTREKKRDILQDNATQDTDACGPEPTERVASLRLAHKVDARTSVRWIGVSGVNMGELQTKNLDVKSAAATAAFGKKVSDRPKTKLSTSKDDSWTLFKPPPVFPVNNSRAKIVPKISYASKVKENLHKAAQAAGQFQAPPGRRSRVPMSAMKTITSASFTNGPMSGDGDGCPSVGAFFTPAACSFPPASSPPSGENVASTLDDYCSSTNSVDLQKCTPIIYPSNPLNMQPVLPSACQAQSNRKALGEIFQNQWGLSFINEPNVWPEGGRGLLVPVEVNTAVVTYQGEPRPSATADPGLDASLSIPEPWSPDSVNRTSAPACIPATVKGEAGTKAQLTGQDRRIAEAKCQVVLAISKDVVGTEPSSAPRTNPVLDLFKGQAQTSRLDRGSRGSFDLKAAVTYHTEEMGYIFNLQKQDPKRIIFYDPARDELD